MEHKMMQYEFPFTEQGQLQSYNMSQIGQMHNLYRIYIRNSSTPHTEKSWRSWQKMYVSSGLAKEYADEYPRTKLGPVVEHQNDKVLMLWERNKLTRPRLEDIIW